MNGERFWVATAVAGALGFAAIGPVSEVAAAEPVGGTGLPVVTGNLGKPGWGHRHDHWPPPPPPPPHWHVRPGHWHPPVPPPPPPHPCAWVPPAVSPWVPPAVC